MNELENVKEQKQESDRRKIRYKEYKTTYNFKKFETIQIFQMLSVMEKS